MHSERAVRKESRFRCTHAYDVRNTRKCRFFTIESPLVLSWCTLGAADGARQDKRVLALFSVQGKVMSGICDGSSESRGGYQHARNKNLTVTTVMVISRFSSW